MYACAGYSKARMDAMLSLVFFSLQDYLKQKMINRSKTRFYQGFVTLPGTLLDRFAAGFRQDPANAWIEMETRQTWRLKSIESSMWIQRMYVRVHVCYVGDRESARHESQAAGCAT